MFSLRLSNLVLLFKAFKFSLHHSLCASRTFITVQRGIPPGLLFIGQNTVTPQSLQYLVFVVSHEGLKKSEVPFLPCLSHILSILILSVHMVHTVSSKIIIALSTPILSGPILRISSVHLLLGPNLQARQWMLMLRVDFPVYLIVHQFPIKTNQALWLDVKTPDPIPINSIHGMSPLVMRTQNNHSFHKCISTLFYKFSCILYILFK